jgi:hypothetical protein
MEYLRKNVVNFSNYPVSVSNNIQNKAAFSNRIKDCISIKVKAKAKINDTIEPFNLIMWYEPTKVFFSLLSNDMANQIK